MPAFFRFISLIRSYYYDFSRYLKYSSAVYPPLSRNQLEAKITARYHNIEKGLTLREVRLGFGKEKIENLLGFLDQYVQQGFDQDRKIFQNTLSVLEEYIKFHKEKKIDMTWLEEAVGRYRNTKAQTGGTLTYSRSKIIKESSGTFESLAFARHSIRDFSSEDVAKKIILEAIRIAQRAPTVCNRQSGRVYIVKDSVLKEKILQVHKGNAGFKEAINTLLIVTTDMETFTSIGERNQSFIDGGLFGMTLIYALHSLGLATCPLNWSAPREQDRALRRIMPIKDSENVMFLIALGHYPEEFKVTKSLRNPLKDVVTIFE